MAGTVVGNLGGFSWHKRTHKFSRTNKKCNKIGGTNHVKNHFASKNESASDDLSSDQDNAGWRFLKSKKRESTPRKISNADRIEVGTDEDEKTEDLLVVFEAAKAGSNRSATSVSAQGTDQSSSKQEVIITRQQNIPKSSASSISTSRRIRTESLPRSVIATVSSPLDNMLVLKDDGEGGFGELSMVSFIDDESIKDLTTPKVMNDDASEMRCVLSSSRGVIMTNNIGNEPDSRKASQTSNRKEHSEGKQLQPEERPSTVSELENCLETEFDMDSSRVLSTCQSNTSNVPSISEINDSIASPTPGPRIISRVPVILNESDDDGAYSDDFDSEPEIRPTPLSLTDSSVAPLSNLVSNRRCNEKRSDRSVKTRGSTQERRNAHKSERKTDPRLSKTTISVEVQTAWTGDFISGYANLTPSGQIPYPMSNDTPELTQTRLQPTSIIRTAVNGKALQTLTEHNPCIVALDNMLKQQVNITRDFLATQRQLHNAISTALSRCLTTDYITWGNTAQILRSGGLP